MMKQFLLYISILTCSINAAAQSAFSLSPNLVEGVKPATNFVLYNYGQFENNTNDSLHMRWVRTSMEVTDDFGQSQGEALGDWSISIQDPNNFYNPAIELDSAAFYLPPIAGAPDKFVLQLYPNNQSGNLLISFLIFPVDNPDDNITITFDYTLTPVATFLSTPGFGNSIQVSPNPAATFLMLENEGATPIKGDLYSPQGILLKSGEIDANSQLELDVSGIPDGHYFLRLESEKQILVKKLMIQK